MMEMITAIALWCSGPHVSDNVGWVNKARAEEQACRERLLKCLTNNSQKCFESEKLK